MLLAISLPVHAERADREKPVNIEADRMNADDNKKSTHFEGRVVLTQGTIRLTADNMTVREDADGFKYASAYGNPVTFRQKREGVNEWVDGMAQHIEYNGKLDRIELFDKAVVHRDKDEIRGNYLSYDTKSEFLQARGAGNADGGQSTPNGRVHVTLQPKNDKTKPGSPSPSQTLKRDSEIAP
ncbi:MAG: lipopolysaccharide transport periplasmic protein LptA [Betaproteobacteria bacterium]|nr:lipopolysaccharide transport periplasmic protein LptA [Betaproteobacteria bacterium]